MLKCGTVLGYERGKAVVMSENCSFIYLDIRPDMNIGQEIWFNELAVTRSSAKRRTRYLSIAAGRVAAVFLIFLLALKIAIPAPSAFAYVDVDINPSTEFVIDKNDIVIKAVPLNEDARKVLQDAELKGLTLDRAIEGLVEKAREQGFIKQGDENNVLLSIAIDSKAVRDTDKRTYEETRLLDYMSRLKSLSQEQQIKSSAIRVSAETKDQADKNGISMGRQEAISIAAENGMDLTVEQMKDYSVKDLEKIIYDDVSVEDKPEKIVMDSIPTSTPTPTTPAPTPTLKPTPKPTPKPTQKPTQKPQSDAPVLSGSVGKTGIVLKWNAINDDGLQGYKVVISESDSTPEYPENGYLYYITDKDKTSVVIDNKTAYNNGDFGEYLTAGHSYYFSITALYEDKKVPGNTIRLKFPAAPTPAATNELNVRASLADGGVYMKWRPVSGENFSYYKIVISKDNSRPRYPEDGYMFYISDINTSSCMVNTNDGYNGGDFDGQLVSGESYYFSITAVFSDDRIIGNAVRLTVP